MSQPAPTTKPSTLTRKLLTVVLLTAIVLLGGYFRFMSLNWDDFASLHPDERYLTLNLLPQIGGALQFTPDNEHFPAQSVLARPDNTVAISEYDVRIDESLTIGAVRGDTSGDLARWWVNADRVSLYASVDNTYQALITGEVDAIIIPEGEVTRFIGASARLVTTFDSIRVQETRCLALNPETNGAGGYFDTYCSPLNPHNAYSGTYAYGTLPLFLAYFTNNFIAELQSPDNVYMSFQNGVLVWRFFSALFDVGSIILIFLIGSRLHNRWVGLLAAVLYACAPLAIQKAHFGTVNSITAFFVMLAIWAAVHVQDKGKLRYYIVFGVALGAALAGRINVIPLAGVVVLAGIVNALPVVDSRIAWSERQRLLWQNVIGVFVAGATTIIAFRIFNPYAFTGPTFLHFIPNMRWIADAQGSSFNVSGASDAPPNWQWLARLPFLYPLRDMLLWGMGIGMGVMAWVGFSWSGLRLLRGKEFAMRNLLPFAWVLVYFGWIGDLWVMTMRYYLPIYGSLALFAAWALYQLYRYSHEHQSDIALTRWLLVLFGIFLSVIPIIQMGSADQTATTIASGILGITLLTVAIIPKLKFRSVVLMSFVVGFTILWGLMFTNIYRNQVTRVQAARWTSENISGDFSMQIDNAPAGTPLVNIGIPNSSRDSATSQADLIAFASRFQTNVPFLIEFTAPASGTVSEVYAPHIADPLDDPTAEILYISIAHTETNQLLTETTLEADFTRDNHPLGDAYTIAFETPVDLIEGETYTFKVEALDGPISTSGEVVITEGTWDDRLTTIMYCELPDGITYADNPQPGLVSASECNGQRLSNSILQSYDLALSYPVDELIKYNSIVDGLEVGDYIAITSNRFYDTETRNPMRFPMTTTYYDALFNGDLGFELIATFSESYQFGPFSVDDQHLPIYESSQWLNEFEADEAFTVYDHPAVFIFRKTADYDQPTVENVLSVPLARPNQMTFGTLESGSQIAGVIYWTSLEANEAPTGLQQPAAVFDANTTGGTWSDRFDSDSILNQNQPIGVAIWWLTLVGIGLLTFPILFTALPRLADRGYGFSKIVGILLVGWAAWLLGNMRVPAWSQSGILLLLILLTILSGYLVYRKRDEFTAYLNQNWKMLLGIEVITLVMFVIFIGVRLTNPDLWHHPMGGEKPMDFAYFNAVLRTTIFPAYDPWYAGGNINYYYFGYVIVGVPTLLLKIVPAFAYNLIVPSLFAMTGIGAFSAAFNIASAWSERQVERIEGEKVIIRSRVGNPWIAGVAALLMCVVLGNLDTPRVVIEEGYARLGGYVRPTGLESYLIDQYIETNGIPPEGQTLLDIQARADRNSIPDRFVYTLDARIDLVTSFFTGIQRSLSGEPLPIGSNRWYWAPTRIIDETPNVGGNAITEMPIFTFVYGDLHAHMIAMPVMLFAIAFIFHELLASKRDERRLLGMLMAVFLGALSIGMMKAINTWDYPTFMVLGVLGLGYAWWRRWEHTFDTHQTLQSVGFLLPSALITAGLIYWFRLGLQEPNGEVSAWAQMATQLPIQVTLMIFIVLGAGATLWNLIPFLGALNRKSIVHHLFYLGGFVLFTVWVVFPYDYWFASAYSRVIPWEGNTTPLWAYWNIHGLFIFLITSLLIWETARWMRSTHVRDLQGYGQPLIIAGIVVLSVLVVSVILMFMGYNAAIIAVPLIVWIAILFFRPDQSLPMQYAMVLAGLALALTLAVEFVVLDGDIGRQNTVFKFYIQVWLFFSVAGGVAFAWVVQKADLWRLWVQLIYFLPLMLMVSAAAMYPFASVNARSVDRFANNRGEADVPLTLNGLDYMENASHYLIDFGVVIPLENDYHIIRWLQENVEGTPVIMEGRSLASEYRYNGRIAINTGLPTVLGWRWHQVQQRTLPPLGDLVNQRERNIRYFYTYDDINTATRIIDYYDIEYIIVSDMEIAMFPDGIEKFNDMVQMGLLSIAYQHGVGLVYQVDHQAIDDYRTELLAFNQSIGLDESMLPPYVQSEMVVGHTPDPSANVADALQTLRTLDADRIVLTNPPRVIQFQPTAYDRFVRLEELGVLQRLDDNEAQRIYQINRTVLLELIGEDND